MATNPQANRGIGGTTEEPPKGFLRPHNVILHSGRGRAVNSRPW